MLDKLAEHFHKNFYPDMDVSEVRAHLDNPEVLDNAMAHIAETGHDDPQVLAAAKAHVMGNPIDNAYKTYIPPAPNPDNQTVQKLFTDYPVLNKFSKPEDYLVQDATGKMKDILSKNKFGLEFQNKGQTDYQVGNDRMTLDNPDKHRLYINPEITTADKRQEAIKLDILSHALHNVPAYNTFQKDLEQKLIAKYGKKMVDGNDGVDAYIRGYLSNSPEYQPYKDEMKFLPPNYFLQLQKILQGN